MQLERERGNDTEVAASAANRPEQVLVSLGIHGYERAIREHHVCFEQVVDGQATGTREVAEATAQGETAHAGARNDAARGCESERVGRVVDVAPRAAARHGHPTADRIAPDTLQQ